MERQRDNLSEEAVKAAMAAYASSSDARAIDAIEMAVDQRVVEAEAERERIRAALSPKGDMAEEVRRDRAWRRYEKKLDAATDSGQVIKTARQALEQCSQDELPVVLDELQPYLESRSAPADWIPAVLATKVPELAKAEDTLAKAKRAQQVTKYNVQAVRSGIERGRPPVAPWSKSNSPSLHRNQGDSNCLWRIHTQPEAPGQEQGVISKSACGPCPGVSSCSPYSPLPGVTLLRRGEVASGAYARGFGGTACGCATDEYANGYVFSVK